MSFQAQPPYVIPSAAEESQRRARNHPQGQIPILWYVHTCSRATPRVALRWLPWLSALPFLPRHPPQQNRRVSW